MWTYQQSDGTLFHSGSLMATGYSGAGAGKNNPEMQSVHDVGPIPQGQWSIGDPVDTLTHGPYVLPLTHVAGEIFGRSGFLIHGDSVVNPGTASEGCIIMPKAIRQAIHASADRDLQVVA